MSQTRVIGTVAVGGLLIAGIAAGIYILTNGKDLGFQGDNDPNSQKNSPVINGDPYKPKNPPSVGPGDKSTPETKNGFFITNTREQAYGSAFINEAIEDQQAFLKKVEDDRKKWNSGAISKEQFTKDVEGYTRTFRYKLGELEDRYKKLGFGKSIPYWEGKSGATNPLNRDWLDFKNQWKY